MNIDYLIIRTTYNAIRLIFPYCEYIITRSQKTGRLGMWDDQGNLVEFGSARKLWLIAYREARVENKYYESQSSIPIEFLCNGGSI